MAVFKVEVSAPRIALNMAYVEAKDETEARERVLSVKGRTSIDEAKQTVIITSQARIPADVAEKSIIRDTEPGKF